MSPSLSLEIAPLRTILSSSSKNSNDATGADSSSPQARRHETKSAYTLPFTTDYDLYSVKLIRIHLARCPLRNVEIFVTVNTYVVRMNKNLLRLGHRL